MVIVMVDEFTSTKTLFLRYLIKLLDRVLFKTKIKQIPGHGDQKIKNEAYNNTRKYLSVII